MPSIILSDNGVSSGSAGLKSTAASDGALALQTTTSGGTATTAVTIDTSQRVGIQTTNPLSTLVVSNGSNENLEFGSGNVSLNGGYLQYINRGTASTRPDMNYYLDSGGGAHKFYTGGSERMRLDASGNLGIGTSSPAARLDVVGTTARVRIAPSVTTDNALVAFVNSGGTSYVGMDSTGGGLTSQYALNVFQGGAYPITFSTNATEAARIDSSGNLLVGITTSAGWGGRSRIYRNETQGTAILSIDNGTQYAGLFYSVTTGGYSTAGAAQWVGRNGGTNRSINAGGTVNASGADYAEYMTKAGDFNVAKGDVIGINAAGKLTNVFADAVSFVVKSTDPSYVGGDVWGTEEAIGMTCPTQPAEDASDEEKAQYETDKAAFDAALEAARQMVDRVAFAGQVPVNVTGATAGQYIIPVDDNGAIKGEAVSSPTFEQYQQAVGKVIAVEQDGRARIIVKVA